MSITPLAAPGPSVLNGRMTRLPWKAGALQMHSGPYYISATRFTYDTLRSLSGVIWHGLRLRSGWPQIDGAVGLSVMVEIRTRSTYTISVWTSHAELQSWVRTAHHARLVKAYRPRLIDSAYEGWQATTLYLAECWRHALRRIGA